METTSLSSSELFGGAMACHIPEGFVDLSDVRQVPNNQECWQEAEARLLLVIEILDLQTSVPDETAGEYFFQDLAESNGISSHNDIRYTTLGVQHDHNVERVPSQQTAAVLCYGKGYQNIVKGSGVYYDSFGNRSQALPQESSWVTIQLALIRLRKVQADILVTLSAPNESNPQETSGGSEVFRTIISSLRIHDWGLFE